MATAHSANVTGKGLKTSRDEWSTGCCFVAYDRDGKTDLFSCALRRFQLRLGASGQGVLVPMEGENILPLISNEQIE
jgi:hypothetical protein